MKQNLTNKAIEYSYEGHLVNWEGRGIYYLHKGELAWQYAWIRLATYIDVCQHMLNGNRVEALSRWIIEEEA